MSNDRPQSLDEPLPPPAAEHRPAPAAQVDPEQRYGLAAERHRNGDLAAAIEHYRAVIDACPQHTSALYGLAVAYSALGEVEQAVHWFHAALRIAPMDPRTRLGLGRAYVKWGKLEEGLSNIRMAIEVNPGSAEACSALSHALRIQGDTAGAIAAAKRGLSIDPQSAEAHLHLGNALQDAGQWDQAVACYQQALQLAPTYKFALKNLAYLLKKCGRREESLSCFERWLQLQPDDAQAAHAMTRMLLEMGRRIEAAEVLERTIERAPSSLQALWTSVHTVPAVYEQESEIGRWRARVEENLSRLESSVRLADAAEVEAHFKAAVSGNNFFLTYQAQDDRSFQQRYAKLAARVMGARFPAWTDPPRGSGQKKLRIGYVSFNFYGHTIAKLFGGWLRKADRERFEIYGYHLGNKADRSSKLVASWCDSHRHLPGSKLEEIGSMIRGDQLDVVTFTDIGMDSYTLLLAAARMAPVQCVSWGHPVTTGLSTVDYFLSSDLMEPPDGESHYTEKLVRLPNLSIFYTRPQRGTADIDRSAFQIGDDRVVYLCCQFLPKYLPQYDFVYPRIAAEVPRATFVFISHDLRPFTETFQRRLKAAFAQYDLDWREHCVFLARLDPLKYFHLNHVADVYLDSIDWSGGNTTFEAISCGLPVVTLPGRFMRGRHSFGMLARMGTTDTVAEDVEDYIRIAARLGREEDARRAARTDIAQRSDLLFEDQAPVDALEAFYAEAVA